MTNTPDPLMDGVKSALKSSGTPLGVNAIAKSVGVPVSTMQKFLERQRYFVKTPDRKWDFPSSDSTLQSGSISQADFDKAIEGQIIAINSTVDLLISSITTVVTFIKSQKPAQPQGRTSVANQPKIDPQLDELNTYALKIAEVFKKQEGNIPEEYKKLFENFNYIGLVLKEGRRFADNFLENDIYTLLAGKSIILSDETVSILTENQLEE